MDFEKKIEQKVKNFKTLSKEECVEIVLASCALSLDECFDYLLIDKAELSDEEIGFCNILHRRGRAIGVKNASDKLFMHMSTRNGGQSALEYLKSMSGEFAVEVTSSQTSSGFSFNVSIPELTEPKSSASVSKG